MIKTILADDEQDSIEILQTLLTEEFPEIEVINIARNALQAVKCITNDKPDLVFLDIQMPGHNGLDVIKNLGESHAIIVFTTAHKDYAIEALRHGAFDYLLKPIDINELKRCVERIKVKLKNKNEGGVTHFGIIELTVKDGSIFIRPSDIIRLEASGSYTTFYLDNNVRHIVSKGIGEYESSLDSKFFYRCHKSHLINLKKVKKFHISSYNVELSDNSKIEIARKNKDEFIEKLKKMEL